MEFIEFEAEVADSTDSIEDVQNNNDVNSFDDSIDGKEPELVSL